MESEPPGDCVFHLLAEYKSNRENVDSVDFCTLATGLYLYFHLSVSATLNIKMEKSRKRLKVNSDV